MVKNKGMTRDVTRPEKRNPSHSRTLWAWNRKMYNTVRNILVLYFVMRQHW